MYNKNMKKSGVDIYSVDYQVNIKVNNSTLNFRIVIILIMACTFRQVLAHK